MALEQDIKQPRFKSEISKLLINLIYTGNWIGHNESRLFKRFELTSSQYNVLRILRGQHPRPATVSLIMERMLDPTSNASRIVDRLEAKQLLTRKQCSDDRRAVDVVISSKGLELLNRLDSEMDDLEKNLISLNNEEAARLNGLLDKVRQRS